MLLSSLVVAGSLALQGVSATVLRGFHASGGQVTEFNARGGHAAAQIDCPQCPFAGPDGNGSAWMRDQGAVKMLFDFDLADNRKVLRANGQPIFPPSQAPLPAPLTARQMRVSDGAISGPLRLGYAFETMPRSSRMSKTSQTDLQLFIFNIEDISLQASTLRIRATESHGRVGISGIAISPYSHSPGAGRCATSTCRLRAIMANHLYKLIQAARVRAAQTKSWAKSCCCSNMARISSFASKCCQKVKTWAERCACCVEKAFGGGGRHSHGRGKDHHHRQRGQFGRFVHQVLLYLLPVSVGIMGGLFACTMGMLVGRGMAQVMNRISNRGRISHVRYAVVEDEKDSLILNDEALPKYADVEVVTLEKQ